MATPESLITGFLEAIAGWRNEAWAELWSSLKTPSNVPIFLGSLIKFSLGPTLAFGFARYLSNQEDKKRIQREQEEARTEIEAIRLMTQLEMIENAESLKDLLKYTFNLLRSLQEQYQTILREGAEAGESLNALQFEALRETFTQGCLPSITVPVVGKKFLELGFTQTVNTFSVKEISSLKRTYALFGTIEVQMRDYVEGESQYILDVDLDVWERQIKDLIVQAMVLALSLNNPKVPS